MRLTGQREAYAANIMHLVSNDLDLRIKMGDIARKSKNLEASAITKAYKKLQSIFKEWFRNNKSPTSLLPKYCNQLGFSQELTETAQEIANKI